MSKIFEEVCSKCCRGCNSYEKDRCRDVWNASEKATEKRVLDEVIEGGIGKEIRLLKSYFDYEGEAVLNINDVKDLWKALETLKQKYGVKR